jgi:hypothetical protein
MELCVELILQGSDILSSAGSAQLDNENIRHRIGAPASWLDGPMEDVRLYGCAMPGSEIASVSAATR